MFGTVIIVFREVLEAAILIGIVAAATRGIAGRNRWLVGGIVLGLLGSALVAFSTESIASLASGMGQELFNATVLGVAVVMLAWHNIWMTTHGAQLAASAKSVGGEIRDGTRECSILLVVIGLAVLREGSETVLFLYGIATSDANSASTMLMAGAIGLAAGAAVGYALYAGLLRVPLRWFFTATSVLVLLLAAGMASQAARFLIQADIIPSLAAPLWDSSGVLSEKSVPGILLHSLIGYEDQPAGMQMVFYVTVLCAIALGMKWANTMHNAKRKVAS